MAIYDCYYLRMVNIQIFNTNNTFVNLRNHNIVELYNINFEGAHNDRRIPGIYFD